MSNPFDNVPSSANLPKTHDKKDIDNLAELVSRIEDTARRFEASAKSSEGLAGAVFEALLDDDGSMKDFGHACEIRMMLRDEATTRAIFHDRWKRQLDHWYEDNAEAIAFGQFYRENFPKQYREWRTGRWQQDIAYRDSLRHAHSLTRLKHLYSPAEYSPHRSSTLTKSRICPV